MGPRGKPDWIGGVLVTDGQTTRRAAEVVIRGKDVFVFQPRKSRVVKITYHESGAFHLRIDPDGKPMFSRQKSPPDQVATEEHMFSKSLENFPTLLHHKGQTYDRVLTVDLQKLLAGLPVVQVAVGYDFPRREDFLRPGYEERVLEEHVLREERPRICVRVLVLRDTRNAAASSEDAKVGGH